VKVLISLISFYCCKERKLYFVLQRYVKSKTCVIEFFGYIITHKLSSIEPYLYNIEFLTSFIHHKLHYMYIKTRLTNYGSNIFIIIANSL